MTYLNCDFKGYSVFCHILSGNKAAFLWRLISSREGMIALTVTSRRMRHTLISVPGGKVAKDPDAVVSAAEASSIDSCRKASISVLYQRVDIVEAVLT